MKMVAIIGFGVMGKAMGQKLCEAGHSLRVFDVNHNAMRQAEAMGAQAASSPADAAKGADVIVLFLPNPTIVAECMTGEKGVLRSVRAGAVVVDMSTVEPGGTRRMAELAARQDVAYLDAPVLGRPSAVGRWALPIGGDAAAIERCRDILELAAAKIIPVGASGSGNTIKLLNQMMFNAINAMTAEMMAVADHMGVSRRLLYETITSSQAGTVSNLFVELGRNVVEETYDNPAFSVQLLCKDLDLAVGMADAAGAPPLLARLIQSINAMAKAQGYGDQDTSVLWKALLPQWSKPHDAVNVSARPVG
jgi:3-hydroxyisobutyrate dehydrogenase